MTEQHNIEKMITDDLHHFLQVLEEKNKLQVEQVIELASYIAANFMRIIYTKQKNIQTEEINGVLGIVSNVLHSIFGDAFTQSDYQQIAQKSLDHLKDVGFDDRSQDYFRQLLNYS